MNISEKDEALVLKYVRGELGSTDYAAFEARLANEPALREAVETYQLGLELSVQHRVETGRAFLQGLANQDAEAVESSPETPGETPGSSSGGSRWFRIAAVILLLAVVGTGLMYLLSPQPLATRALAQFEVYESEVNTAGSTDYEEAFLVAMNSYSMGDYATALVYLRQTKVGDRDAVEKLFYRGNAEMATDPPEYRAAIASFVQVEELATPEFKTLKDFAKWYRGLALAISGDSDAAQQLFSEMIAEEGFNARLKAAARKLR